MPKHSNDRLQGTLDLLILKVLDRAGRPARVRDCPTHSPGDVGFASDRGRLLYPALQRMTHEKWLKAQWGATDSGRKARFYTITAAGRRQLEEEERRWLTLTDAVNKALRFA